MIKPEWYYQLLPYLTMVGDSTSKKPEFKKAVRMILKSFDPSVRRFKKGRTDQVVFTTKEVEVLGELCEILGMEQAQKRFETRTVRV